MLTLPDTCYEILRLAPGRNYNGCTVSDLATNSNATSDCTTFIYTMEIDEDIASFFSESLHLFLSPKIYNILKNKTSKIYIWMEESELSRYRNNIKISIEDKKLEFQVALLI